MKIFRFLLITLLLFPARISFAQSLRESEGPRAMQWLKQNGQRYGISQDMLKGAYVADAVPSRKSGAFHVYVQQVHDDVRVLNGIAGVTFGSDRLFFNLNDNFCKAQFPAKQMLISEAEATEKAIPGKLSPEESFKREKHSLSAASFKNGTVRYEENGIYTEPMWVPAEDGTVVLCWNITFYQNSTGDWHNIFINAANGKTEKEINWTLHCAFGKHVPSVKNITAAATAQTALASDGATYNVFAFPIESPNHGNRALISSPADDVASPFGWHDTNGADGPEYSITRGNNVYAALDQVADNVPEGSPDGGSGLFFSYAYSSSSAPSDFEDFAVTQLFYANNVLHDIAYHYGFDEASGNFQENNYGKGGSGSDGVNADAQDGSGTNNANFSTPPDGTNSRMQMYLWNNSGAAGLLVKSPSNIAKLYKVGVAQFGAKLTKVPVSGKLVAVSDASSKPQKGCASFTNPSAVSGNIALIERGNCTFGRKTWNAQNAGAIAVIIYDTTTSGALITMAADNSIQDPLEIPAVFISRADGLALKNELANDVQVSLYDSSGAAGTLDADLDNGVMAHEYGHGISIRLTCGPSNSNGLSNQEQMGEGWSDFFSLAYTAKPGDAGSTPRGIGTYLIGEPITGGGIRTYPYTTDMGINLHTYNSIKTESVPHGVGSVWCAMLWDLYWLMVQRHGFDEDLYNGNGGNNKMIQLVIDGMKLQKCNPGFVDARNAILKADTMNYGGANSDLIWKAFARRGLGYSANQGLSTSRSDGTQAFDLPPTQGGGTSAGAIAAQQLLIYPVPVKDLLMVDAGELKPVTISVSDALGRVVRELKAIGSAAVPMGDMSAGNYFVKVQMGSSVMVRKIVKN